MKLAHHNRYDYSPLPERPDFDWPEGKRLAFYLALNVEDFAFGGTMGHTPTSLGPPPGAITGCGLVSGGSLIWRTRWGCRCAI